MILILWSCELKQKAPPPKQTNKQTKRPKKDNKQTNKQTKTTMTIKNKTKQKKIKNKD